MNDQSPCVAGRRRARVLMLAYACGPGRGSEPGVGWNRALEAAKRCDVTVICEEHEFAASIERHFRQTPRPEGLEFVFVPKHRIETAAGRVPGLYYLTYNLWHRRAYRAARELHARRPFDLAHQANMCGFREPGYLWRLDAPFIWGPVGGTQNHPWRFLPVAGTTGAVAEACRSTLNWLQLRHSRRVHAAAKRASLLIAANATNRRALAGLSKTEPVLQCDVGLSAIAGRERDAATVGPLRILWSGNFHPFKALPILLRALAALPADAHYELRVLGDGPCSRSWRKLSRSLKLEPHVRWLGRLPHPEAVEQARWADVLAFTSLRDTTGSVILEALGAGAPVICFDHQGGGDVVVESCGVKIPVTTPRVAIAAWSAALERLARSRQLRRELSLGALARARQFLWSRHGQEMAGFYRRILGDDFDWSNRGGLEGPPPAELASQRIPEPVS